MTLVPSKRFICYEFEVYVTFTQLPGSHRRLLLRHPALPISQPDDGRKGSVNI